MSIIAFFNIILIFILFQFLFIQKAYIYTTQSYPNQFKCIAGTRAENVTGSIFIALIINGIVN